jgi:endonuclease YncB( thermonuclease family)
MLKISNIFIVLLLVLISSPTSANILKIIDGDTIHIGKIKYRLYGIDAPEIKQECERNNKKYLCGVEATKFLQSLIKDDESINCVNKNIDRYKRIVAVCHYLNEDLSKLMVRNGWAIAYRRYSKDYVDDENYAKENKLGIWNGQFIEPYKWRKKN